MRQFRLIDLFGWTAIFGIFAALWPWSKASVSETVIFALGIAGTIAAIVAIQSKNRCDIFDRIRSMFFHHFGIRQFPAYQNESKFLRNT